MESFEVLNTFEYVERVKFITDLHIVQGNNKRKPDMASRQRLINDMSDVIKSKLYLLDSYKTAICSIKETEYFHTSVILKAIVTLLDEGREVTSQDLLNECYTYTQHFSESDLECLNERFPESALQSMQDSQMTVYDFEAGDAPVEVSSLASMQMSTVPGEVKQKEQGAVGFDVPDRTPLRSSPLVDDRIAVAVEQKSGYCEVQGATASEDGHDKDEVTGGVSMAGLTLGSDPRLIKECLWAVQHENRILESYKLCTVCRKNPRDITFLPCGHFVTCRECANPIFNCNMCSRPILATIDTFLS